MFLEETETLETKKSSVIAQDLEVGESEEQVQCSRHLGL